MYFLQLPQRGTADRSPGGEEVENNRAALEAVQVEILTPRGGEREGWGHLADPVTHL